MSFPNCEDPRFGRQFKKLENFNQFISQIATAIVSGNDEFESVWTVANRVYDRYCSPKVTFMPRPDFDESGKAALSA